MQCHSVKLAQAGADSSFTSLRSMYSAHSRQPSVNIASVRSGKADHKTRIAVRLVSTRGQLIVATFIMIPHSRYPGILVSCTPGLEQGRGQTRERADPSQGSM